LVEFNARFVAGAGAAGMVQLVAFKQKLGSRAAPLVFTANKEEVGQVNRLISI
jgi:hypothetical protein